MEEAAEAFESSHPGSLNELMECPACLCLLASKDPSRLQSGELIRELIASNTNIKEEFFKRSRSAIAAHAFWNSFEALTSRYHKEKEEDHIVSRETVKNINGPVIFASLLNRD